MDNTQPEAVAHGMPGDRRSGGDRRRPPSFPPPFSAHRRRKSAGRRKSDRGGYVDIYNAQSWVVAMSILGLSCLDAGFTALHLESGHIREANPLMEGVMRFGGFYTFVTVKSAMTAFALAIIILHKEWRLGRLAARWTLLGYVLLTIYHGYLLAVTP